MAKNVWGIIMIVIGIIFGLVGVVNLMDVHNQAQQLEMAANMMGGFGGNGADIMKGFAAMSGVDVEAEIRNGYIVSTLVTVVGISLAVFGTKLLSKHKKSELVTE
jgi:hypothetical protein